VTAENIRSFTLLGASGSGKTSLAEALLYRAGVLHQLGRSENGGSFLDSEPEEANRAATVLAKVQSLAWGKYRVYLADTPGFADFIGQAIAPLAVLDAAVIVIDGTGGVDVATKQLYDLAKAHARPILFFVNKLDRERADFRATVASLRKNLSPKAYPVTLPLGHGTEFHGVLDVLNAKAYGFDEGKVQEIPVPADAQAEREEAFQQLSEEVAASDDALLEKVLNGEQLTQEELSRQLVQAVKEGAILPVLCGTAFPARGTTLLLDAITNLVPPTTELSPPLVKESETAEPVPLKLGEDEPAVAQVFRVSSDPGVGDLFFLKVANGTIRPGDDLINVQTKEKERLGHLFRIQGRDRKELSEAVAGDVVAVAKLKNSSLGHTLGAGKAAALPPIRFPDPVHAVSIIPKSRKDQDKMGPAVGKLVATDPTLEYRIDPEFNETILSGMGEVHLEFVAGRLKDRYGVELEWGAPHIPYRQTLTKKVEAQGRHKKQTGGHGQFGDCQIRVEPLPWGTGFEFEDDIKGGVIPGKWVPSVESGVRQAMKKGILGGYPVVDVRVSLFYGSYHSVDSSDMAFQIAGSLAFKKAEEQAGPILLEPIMRVDVIAPGDYVGAINGDLTSRRGRVIGMDQEGDLHVVRAEVPQAELFRYSTDLRSLTQGAGSFRMQYSRYEQVPSHLVEDVVKKAKAEAEKAKGG
jgi:elongation factor G